MHYEEIMERLNRLSTASINMRDGFSVFSDSRWYASMDNVTCSGKSGGSSSFCGNGYTPESAVQNLWEEVLKNEKRDGLFLRKHSCPNNVNIPGNDPQIWVRWNSKKDDWENVTPSQKDLESHRIPEDRVIKYQRVEN
ncbi:MAG: hypothetical protein WC849_01200 [Candidatus Paceibacterota bacterium]